MKKIILLICIVGSFFSCKDFLNLTPKNQVVVYTMEDVKQTMSSYLFAMASDGQAIYFNGEAITFPFDSDISASFAMYGNDVNMTEVLLWYWGQVRGFVPGKYRMEWSYFSRTFVETFLSFYRLYE